MGAGAEAGLSQHRLDLASDQRDPAGGLLVGLGGEQADEANFPRGAAVGAVPLDPDVVHVAAPVDARAQIRLGHHQRRIAEIPTRGLRQHRRLGFAAQHGAGAVAQHAQPRLGVEARFLGSVIAVLGARVLVDAGPQEHKTVGREPAQEGQILVQLPPRGGGGGALQLIGGRGHQGAHGVEVLDRTLHVGEGCDDAFAQGLGALGAGRLDQNQDHGLPAKRLVRLAAALIVARNLQHRMEHRPHGEAAGGDLAHHAVDQEGPVVLNHLQRLQLDADIKVDQPHLRTLAGPARGEVPEVGRCGREVRGRKQRPLVVAEVDADLSNEVGAGGRGSVGAERCPDSRRVGFS